MSGSAMNAQRRSELKCPSCQNWFDETRRTPKQTECGHNVCVSCIMNLLGEPLQGPTGHSYYMEHYIPQNRTFSCPLCYAVVKTDGIYTNRPLVEKISALAGLEALIYTDEQATLNSSQEVKPQPPLPSGQPQAPPFQQPNSQPSAPSFQQPEYQPQLEATGLGWAVPTEPPRPDMPHTQTGIDQHHLGWALPGITQQGVPGSLDSQQSSMLPPQQMPHPNGVPFTYSNPGPQY